MNATVESPKLRRLRELRQLLVNGRITQQDMKRTQIADTDGSMVRLDDPGAVAVLDRCIAAEEAAQAV